MGTKNALTYLPGWFILTLFVNVMHAAHYNALYASYTNCLCRLASFFPFFASLFSFRVLVGSFLVVFLVSRALLMMLSYYQIKLRLAIFLPH